MTAWIRQNRVFLVLLLGFGLFRTAVADWNPIPSGSMRPTVLEGDVVFVDRLAYDLKLPLTDLRLLALAEPRRGDIVTFSSPVDGTRLIKRLVALPGDRVEVRDGVLWLNGRAAPQTASETVPEVLAPGLTVPARRAVEVLDGRPHPVQWLVPEGQGGAFGPFTVPPGHYFMLGDNRDNSADSRMIGPVPRHALIGRAVRVLVSADITGHWGPRWARFGTALP